MAVCSFQTKNGLVSFEAKKCNANKKRGKGKSSGGKKGSTEAKQMMAEVRSGRGRKVNRPVRYGS